MPKNSVGQQTYTPFFNITQNSTKIVHSSKLTLQFYNAEANMKKIKIPDPKIPDPIDLVDTFNVFFLGPNAAMKESNRKKAHKQFKDEFKMFGFKI